LFAYFKRIVRSFIRRPIALFAFLYRCLLARLRLPDIIYYESKISFSSNYTAVELDDNAPRLLVSNSIWRTNIQTDTNETVDPFVC